jgi:hypothetical protein
MVFSNVIHYLLHTLFELDGKALTPLMEVSEYNLITTSPTKEILCCI